MKLDPRSQAFTGSNRNAGRGGNFADRLHLVRWAGFLEPQGIVGLESPRQPNRRRCRHLTMSTEEDIGPVTDRFANLAQVVFATVELGQRQFATSLETVRPGRVLLDRGKTHIDIIERACRRRITVVLDIGCAFTRTAVGGQGSSNHNGS